MNPGCRYTRRKVAPPVHVCRANKHAAAIDHPELGVNDATTQHVGHVDGAKGHAGWVCFGEIGAVIVRETASGLALHDAKSHASAGGGRKCIEHGLAQLEGRRGREKDDERNGIVKV